MAQAPTRPLPATPTLTLPRSTAGWRQQPGMVLMVLAMLLIGGLAVAQSSLFSQMQPVQQIGPDSRATLVLLDGMHRPEFDQRGAYRWTAGSATIRLAPLAQAATPVLELALGPAPPTNAPDVFTVRVGAGPPIPIVLDDRPRRYLLAVPPDALRSAALEVVLDSATTTVGSDPRPVGLRFEGLSISYPSSRVVLANPLLLAVQAGMLLATVATLWRLRVHLLLGSMLLVLLAGLLLLAVLLVPLLALPYLLRLLPAVLLLAGLTLLLLPPAERHLHALAPPHLLRVLWGVALLAVLLRLSGSSFPLFGAFDLGLNLGRLEKTVFGDLIVTSRSIEFRNQLTIYPPGPYLLLMPGLLFDIPPKLLVQGGVAVADGLAALGVGLLARALGSNRRTAVLAAVLYAVNPLNLTVLWFGLTAQIIGQALMLPLAVMLLVAFATPPDHPAHRLRWVLVAVLLGISLLSHIGVAVIVAAWVVLVWLLAVLLRAAPWRTLRAAAVAIVAAGMFSFVVLYSVVALLKLQELLTVRNLVATEDHVNAGYRLLIWNALRVSYTDWGLLLLVAGTALFAQRSLSHPQQAVLWAAVLTALLFLLVEMFTALQVRYVYFIVPFVYIAIALLLDRLAWRAAAGVVVASALLLWFAVFGSVIWYLGTFLDIMMDMTPLVR